MNSTTGTLLIVLTAALVTIAIRSAPFVFFNNPKGIPVTVRRLGNVLPPAIMGTLIIFTIKNVDLFSGSHGIPEFLGILITVGLHVFKRNTLISIAGGTALYMLLIRIM